MPPVPPINLRDVVQPGVGGPTGSPNPDLGALAAGLLQLVMEQPAHAMRTALGGGSEERFMHGIEAIRGPEPQPVMPDQMRKLSPGEVLTGLGGAGLREMRGALAEFPMQMSDPINYIGGAGKAAQAAREAHAATPLIQAGKVAPLGQLAPEVATRALEMAAWLESAPGKALQGVLSHGVAPVGRAILDSPVTGPLARGFTGRNPVWRSEEIVDTARQTPQGYDPLSRLVDTKLDPQSLLEVLRETSTQSKVHARDAALTETGQLLGKQGHNFEDLLREMDNAKSMFMPPVETQRGGMKVLDYAPNIQRLQGLEDDAWKAMQGMSDPRAKLAGIEILGQVQEQAVRMWNDKLVALEKSGIGGLQANAAHAAWDSMYREAYHDLQRIYTGGQRAMRMAEREVGNLEKLDPATAQQYEQLWQYSHQMMENARSSSKYPIMGMFPQPQDPMTVWGQRLPGMQLQMVDMVKSALEPQRANLEKSIGGVRSTITGLPAAMSDQLLDPGTAQSLMSRGLEHAKMLELGLPGALADLPAFNRNILMQHLDDLKKQSDVILGKTPAAAGAVGGGLKGKFEKTLQTIYEAQTGTPYTPKALGADTLEHFNNTIRSMNPAMAARLDSVTGGKGIQSGKDFTEFARSLVPDSTLNSLRKDLTKYPGGDILTADLFPLVKDRVIRQYAKGLGLSENVNPFVEHAGTVMNLWKESALLAPAYHAANEAGGLFMQALEGINPLRTMEANKENIGKILMGGPGTDIVGSHSKALMDRLEMLFPPEATGAGAAGMRDESYNLARELSQKGLPASQRIGGPKLSAGLGAFGGLAGNMNTPDDASPQERAINIAAGAGILGGAGALFPKASAKNMDIGRGLEDILRKEVFTEGVRRTLPGLRPELTKIVDDALDVIPEMISSTGTGRQITTLPISPNTRRAIHDIIEHEQGIMGPSMIEGLLRRGGVAPDVAKIASDEWRDALLKARRNGLDLSNTVNFNYQDLNPLQQGIRDYVPFSTWGMKALPFFGRHMLENPWLLMKMAQLENASNQERKEQGLPGRFAGAVQTPIADEVWSQFLGRPVKTAYNPMRGLLPFSDIGRGLQGQEGENPIQTALRLGQAVGLPGIGPVPETILRTTGLMGEDAPDRGYIRQGNPIQYVTGRLGLNRGAGIDVNKPFVAAQDLIRRTAGQHPVDTETRAIQNRLDEMAFARTGFTTQQREHPEVEPFITAKLGERGPLWDEARRDVAQLKSGLGTGNFIVQGLTPQAVIGPEEATFRGTRAQVIPQDTQRLFSDIQQEVQRNPQGDASKYAPALRTIAVQLSQAVYDQGVLQQGEISPRLERLLANPTATNINEVRQSIQKELAARNPTMGGYGQSGNSEEARLKVLLEAYNNVPALIKQDPALASLTPDQIAHITQVAGAIEQGNMSPQVKQMLGQGKDPLALQIKALQSRKDMFRKQPGNEMLDKYLNYMAGSRGTGTMEGFFQQLTTGK